jgi:nucleoside-diphosphate-sugar epimerase
LIESVKDPERELVRPAVEGTRNVLETVQRSESVRRVVLTSSVAAVYGDGCEIGRTRGAFDERYWNETSSLTHNPYPFSKVAAEKVAWQLAESQSRWDLVTINPGLVLGPSLTKQTDSYSVQLMRDLLRGRRRTGVPRLSFGCVDVRDVAEAHLLAGDTPTASGRYIVVARDATMLELARLLKPLFPSHRLPNHELPKFVVWLAGPLSAGISREYVTRNVGYIVHFDSSKSERDLGLRYRPLEETLADHGSQLIADKLVRAA